MDVSLADFLEKFADVRAGCPAINRILVPEAEWSTFRDWHATNLENEADHHSVLLVAFLRGHLSRITSSIHRFILKGNDPQENLRSQYVQDLRERWMMCADTAERHRKWRMFFGRLVELQVAEWLEHVGWTVTALEAFRPGADIEATDRTGHACSLEVKLIGASDDDFSRILESMTSGFGGGMGSLNGAANYLLFRVYEAAKQLEGSASRTTAVVVIDALAWGDFEHQIRNGRIDWHAPVYRNAGAEWEEFLRLQARRYPLVERDLQPTLARLGSLVVLRRGNRYEYTSELEVTLAT